MKINMDISAKDLLPKLEKLFELSAIKIDNLNKTWHPRKSAPVYTIDGLYTSKGWTEWTRGFQYGLDLLQFDASGDKKFLERANQAILKHMALHLSHTGVHDHGFNNVSTYGNLLRLSMEGKIPENEWQRYYCELALKISGAVQASRWTSLADGLGYIYSFNGPHSLFADTIRSLRVLALAHQLGHRLLAEQEISINLLERLIIHAETTARYNVYFGEDRDLYDKPGRVAHESVFNIKNGTYRCASTQQGYSPFSTWMRGLAWIITGYAEELEFLNMLSPKEFRKIKIKGLSTKEQVLDRFLQVAQNTADFYIRETPVDGIPYWDTGAPGLEKIGNYLEKLADPFNDYEPVDSSAAIITAQGLLRLGTYLLEQADNNAGKKYFQAGLTIADQIFSRPYLSINPEHQGLILHSVYHRPKNWDNIPDDRNIPCRESSLWGDYHALELAVYIQRLAQGKPYYKFFI